ncbi:MAG: endonuclease [Cytophagales bacterium CG18_big_fil_WC_8_21_14_2_50_42_9]|nr:MAG: endonuclease [Cytophagales bacterium CG18_big_fil_WC_8_21_14_2_50_42_9]
MQKKLLLSTMLLMLAAIIGQAQSLNIATYNLRYDNKGDSLNPWPQRLPMQANLIKFHDFDIFGTQEGLYHQLQDLKKALPDYDYLGVGRDDGKQAGEFSAIFYKTAQFKVLDKGNFWLAPVTDKPNKGWDAALPRICSWAKFQEKKSGNTFYFFNVHFDHRGKQAQAESAKLLLQKVKAIAGSAPSILTGDFNVDQREAPYDILNNSALLKDAYELTPLKYAGLGTFNSFDIKTNSDSRIDHIFLTSQFKVKRYGILTDSYKGKVPSDHFPVLIEVTR